MRAIDILDHMMALWREPPRDTVDRVIYGDPQREVQAVVVHHAVTEEPGVAALARYLSDVFPQVTVTHLRQGCVYREVACPGTA